MQTIKFKKMYADAVEPRKATVGAAGFDMTAIGIEQKENFWRYHTGIALELPPGWAALVFPRSSIVKTGAILGNCVGVIDSDYRGEIMLCFYTKDTQREHFVDCAYDPPYKVGERIGQLVIIPAPEIVLEEAVELSETERGAGGYGSTGA